MLDIDPVEDLLGHAEDGVDLAHPLLPEQGEPRHPEQSVERVREVARSIGKSSGFSVLKIQEPNYTPHIAWFSD